MEKKNCPYHGKLLLFCVNGWFWKKSYYPFRLGHSLWMGRNCILVFLFVCLCLNCVVVTSRNNLPYAEGLKSMICLSFSVVPSVSDAETSVLLMLTTWEGGGGVTSWNHEKIPKCLSALFHTTFKHFASTKLIWHNKRKKILPLLSLLCSFCLYSSCQSVCLFGGRYTQQTGWTLLLGYIHIKSGCLAPSWRITWRCGSVCVITQNYCGD